MLFTQRNLESLGFTGWHPFSAIRTSDCPKTGGVYVVTYRTEGPIAFVQRGCGGWFKGKCPTVSIDALAANWVDGAEVVYIGKANQLRRRLTQYADFGAGKPVGHWGGRLIWQLSEIDQLIVGWKETPDITPVVAKTELIGSFRQTYGQPPFANYPDRLGR